MHSTSEGIAASASGCPRCGGGGGFRDYGGGYRRIRLRPRRGAAAHEAAVAVQQRVRAKWSRPGSSVLATPTGAELTPIREAAEGKHPLISTSFPPRVGRPARSAKQLHDLLEERGVKAWFSEGRWPRRAINAPSTRA